MPKDCEARRLGSALAIRHAGICQSDGACRLGAADFQMPQPFGWDGHFPGPADCRRVPYRRCAACLQAAAHPTPMQVRPAFASVVGMQGATDRRSRDGQVLFRISTADRLPTQPDVALHRFAAAGADKAPRPEKLPGTGPVTRASRPAMNAVGTTRAALEIRLQSDGFFCLQPRAAWPKRQLSERA